MLSVNGTESKVKKALRYRKYILVRNLRLAALFSFGLRFQVSFDGMTWSGPFRFFA